MGHLVDIQRPIPFSCEACKHFISGCRCKAFDVIPIELFGEAESHNKVLKSQNGDFVFETTKIKGKKTAILPLEYLVPAVRTEKDKNKLAACAQLRGQIKLPGGGILMDGEKMGAIINAVQELDLTPIGEKRWNRHLNTSIYDPVGKESLVDSLDWCMRTAIAKQKNREFGFITLYTDGNGNYSMGIKEQTIFPEIDYDKINKVLGMDICVVTSAANDEQGRALLEALGFPFRK